MKRKTLFTILPHQTDVAQLKASLSEHARAQLEALIGFIHERIGVFEEASTYYYRVTNTNYIKVRFTGARQDDEQGNNAPTIFHLMIVVAGHTEFPSLALANSMRLTMTVADATDAFWLTELLRYELKHLDEVA